MCMQLVRRSYLEGFCRTECVAPVIPKVPIASSGPCGISRGKKVCSEVVAHPTHKMSFWPKYLLHFCTCCGRIGTVDFRHLAERCPGKNRNGQENLSRIRKGLYPRREGPPRAVIAALHQAETEEAAAAASMKRPPSKSESSSGASPGSLGPVPSVGDSPRAGRPEGPDGRLGGRCSPGGSAAEPRTCEEWRVGPPDPEEEAAEWLGVLEPGLPPPAA